MSDIENAALIRRFIEAYVRADADELAGFFTEDAAWWNAPWPAVTGREANRETFRRGARRMNVLPWEVRFIAGGGVVMTERVDHFTVGAPRIRVPCMGIFEARDGRIAAWRDDWDLKEFERQLPEATETRTETRRE